MHRGLWSLLLLGLAGCGPTFEATRSDEARPRVTSAWPEYGGGGGRRYADAALIDAGNVADLEIAWIYRTGDASDGGDPAVPSTTAFEATPILAGGRLVFCSPFNRVIALDPLTGGELWQHDPAVDLSGRFANQLVCRGVAQWHEPGEPVPGSCRSRIFTATNDGRLIALDLETGTPCPGFGDGGQVDLNPGAGAQAWYGEYQVTSAPTVVGDLVVVGSAVSDNQRRDAPSGVVRAFDVRRGAQVWAWDLAPPGFDHDAPGALVSDEGFALGTPNVWGTMTADEARGLIFVPTGNPSPDYFRSGTPRMDHYGSAVVALRAASGEVVWHFNTVRHDYWDYDVGAQPALADLVIDGVPVPALIQGTKMGFVFVLHRETGEPLVDVDLQPVPRHGPLAAELSPLQPFPPSAYRLGREVTRDDAWGLTFWDRGRCRALLDDMDVGPIYTPVTERWTVVSPSNSGGINWGGVAVDQARGVIVARSSHLPFQVRLIAAADLAAARSDYPGDVEIGPQRGMPYAMARKPLLSPLGLPCTTPPWGTLTAIDIAAGEQRWQRPHGTVRDLSPVPLPREYGIPGLGQGIITGSGLVFIGAAFEHALRAFDLETGEERWLGRLPAPPVATPMTYVVEEGGRERQFVVIAAGGHGRSGISVVSDHLVAFALPEPFPEERP